MSAAAPPTVIEIALNGMTTKEQNPHVPRTVDEIVEDGLRCLDAGASIVHHHNDEPNFGGATRHCAGPYIDVWSRLRASRPGLLLHPTTAGATADSTIEERYAHVVELYDAGLAPVGSCDAGMLALAALTRPACCRYPRPSAIPPPTSTGSCAGTGSGTCPSTSRSSSRGSSG